jgi:DNA helicase-2/ATP-dependent DNA helicase PcrA
MSAPPRARAWQGHAEMETPAIKRGQNVLHASFGRGVVTDYEGSGAHARVQVNFDDVGSKWLVLAYANLSAA